MSIKAKLNTFDTTMIVVSLVIGVGIFRTPPMVAAATKTPRLFFATWTAGGLISLLGALTFAEIGSRFPKAGSYYKVVAECHGSWLAFMLNWINVLFVNGVGAAAVATIGAEYLCPILLPAHLRTPQATQLTAAGLILVLFAINYAGIRTGAWAQDVLTVLKLLVVAAIVVAAIRFRGAVEQSTLPGAGDRPWALALGTGLISVLYAYGGYQCTINFGADIKSSRATMPRGIFWGIAIILACYLLLNGAYVRVLGIAGVAGAELVAAEVARRCFGEVGHLFISLAIVLSALGFLNVTLMQIPRAYYAMAADGVLPPIFMRVNQRTQVQEFTLTFFVATILLSIAFLATFEKMVGYIMFLDCLTIAVVASTLFVLRRRGGTAAYQVPGYPVLPVVFILCMLIVPGAVAVTQPWTALAGMVVCIAGYPVFVVLRRINRLWRDPWQKLAR
ncbi:MAG: amino acid permease [candidate division KSB1 bacterium]|nr:amino acid permease [candidate division KSB1 bacterium]